MIPRLLILCHWLECEGYHIPEGLEIALIEWAKKAIEGRLTTERTVNNHGD
jgi:hypothetical protein